MPINTNEELRSQVYEVLRRFNDLVSTKNRQVLAEFAPDDDVLLVGSDAGEVARGQAELEAFFTRIFAGETSFSWEWERLEVSCSGDLAWLFADGQVILSADKEQRKSPYRITGVLERQGERWHWRQYHGAEPVSSA